MRQPKPSLFPSRHRVERGIWPLGCSPRPSHESALEVSLPMFSRLFVARVSRCINYSLWCFARQGDALARNGRSRSIRGDPPPVATPQKTDPGRARFQGGNFRCLLEWSRAWATQSHVVHHSGARGRIGCAAGESRSKSGPRTPTATPPGARISAGRPLLKATMPGRLAFRTNSVDYCI